jgi:outer membrane receptor protein involved in Fe transport
VKNPTDELKERLDEMDKQMSYLAEEITVRNEYSARLLVNLGARYTIKDLELSFDIHNLFNHKYSQSGMSTGPIPQKGMWFMGSIAYKF